MNGKQKTQGMHRLILGLKHGDPLEADHIDHNTLDNRLDNLRIVDRRKNQENRRDQSKFGPGVRKRSSTGKFEAHAKVSGKWHHIGTYDLPEEAQEARKSFLREKCGDGRRSKK